MVAINRLFLAGALAATVSAAPIDAPQTHSLSIAGAISIRDAQTSTGTETNSLPISIPVSISIADNDVISIGECTNEIVRRDTPLPSLVILLSEATTFIINTLTNVLDLDVSTESDSISELLVEINQFILNLETDLISYKGTSGIGSEVKKLLVQTGLQSFILGISNIVADLQAKILKNGGTPSPSIEAQFTALQANLTSLQTALKNQSLLSDVGDFINVLQSTLKSLTDGI